MDAPASQLSSAPSAIDGELASCIKQLNVSVKSLHAVVGKLQVTLDSDRRAIDGLKALTSILSGGDAKADSRAHSAQARAQPSSRKPDDDDGSDSSDDDGDDDDPIIVNAPLPAEKEKWYAVIVGREPGVFGRNAPVAANVSKIPGGSIVRCDSEGLAQHAFDEALIKGEVEKVELIINRKKMEWNDYYSD